MKAWKGNTLLSVEYLTTLGGAFLRVRGRLNQKSRHVFTCMLEQAVRQGARHAVVDLSRARPLDRAGLEALEQARRHMHALGGSLNLIGV